MGRKVPNEGRGSDGQRWSSSVWKRQGEVAMEERLQKSWRGAEMKMSPEEPFTQMPERSQLPPQLQFESPPNPSNDNGYRACRAHSLFKAME